MRERERERERRPEHGMHNSKRKMGGKMYDIWAKAQQQQQETWPLSPLLLYPNTRHVCAASSVFSCSSQVRPSKTHTHTPRVCTCPYFFFFHARFFPRLFVTAAASAAQPTHPLKSMTWKVAIREMIKKYYKGDIKRQRGGRTYA